MTTCESPEVTNIQHSDFETIGKPLLEPSWIDLITTRQLRLPHFGPLYGFSAAPRCVAFHSLKIRFLHTSRIPRMSIRAARRFLETFPVQKRPEQDRKSTRLNSSHVVISYAVFCLKKKKAKTNHLVYHIVHNPMTYSS